MLDEITVLELHLDAPNLGIDRLTAGEERDSERWDSEDEPTENERERTRARFDDDRTSARIGGSRASVRSTDDGSGARSGGRRTDAAYERGRTDTRIEEEGTEEESGGRNWRVIGLALGGLAVSVVVALIAYRRLGNGGDEGTAVEPPSAEAPPEGPADPTTGESDR